MTCFYISIPSGWEWDLWTINKQGFVMMDQDLTQPYCWITLQGPDAGGAQGGKKTGCETVDGQNPERSIWMFPKIRVITPKSSILIGFSIINHPFSGTPIFGNTHIVDIGKIIQKTDCWPICDHADDFKCQIGWSVLVPKAVHSRMTRFVGRLGKNFESFNENQKISFLKLTLAPEFSTVGRWNFVLGRLGLFSEANC